MIIIIKSILILPLEATINGRYVMYNLSAIYAMANRKQHINVRNLFISLSEDMNFLIRIVETITSHERCK